MSGTRWTLFAALAVLCRRVAKRTLERARRKAERWHGRADWCEGRTGPTAAPKPKEAGRC